MKTIKDLVDHLNATFDYADFSISADNKQQFYYIFMTTITEYGELIEFNQQSKDWDIMPTLGTSNNEIQKEIMDFVYSTDKEHWFDEPEKKYNIIIGENVKTEEYCVLTAYRKTPEGIEVWAAMEEYLTSDAFKFTESEIEELKSKVSERSANIIDLGKVEVKDDEDWSFSWLEIFW